MTSSDPVTQPDNASEYIDFWQLRYDEGVLPWDLGGPSPHFTRFLNAEKPVPGKLAVLGCGRGHDGALFADAGFDVTGFDYAPGAVAEANRLYGDRANWVRADIFALGEQYRGRFDYVAEHACFCAIPRRRREDYVDAVSRLLKPGGEYLAVFWMEFDDADGPPFSTSPDEIRRRFGPDFEILALDPVPENAGGRDGREYLARLRKKFPSKSSH